MAAEANPALRAAVEREPDYVRVPVKLSAKDRKHLKRVFEDKYEPLEDADLIVRVKLARADELKLKGAGRDKK